MPHRNDTKAGPEDQQNKTYHVAGSAGCREGRGVAVLTELVISLLALLVSLPPLFESFKILSFNLFM